MSREYHYLVAGLPDFTFDDKKVIPSVLEFKNTLKDHLHPNDYKLIELLFLTFDNQNLLSFLKIRKHELSPLGNYKLENFEDEIARLNSIIPEKPLLPKYLCDFIQWFHDENKPKTGTSRESLLTSLYYEYVVHSKNIFFKNWFEFELNLQNTLTAIICRNHKFNLENEIIGNNNIALQLKTNPSKDFGLNIDFPIVEKIIQIADLPKIIDRERNIDLLKWAYLDEETKFHYFDIEFVASYLIKLIMVNRWLKLDQETGRAMFNRMISDIEKSYEFPEEFKL